ncbi:hypothetical protein KO116_04114 [Halomonas sp. KO116]|nr:hypothetical protein KO116_04114 [Halomonas sp. KO116]
MFKKTTLALAVSGLLEGVQNSVSANQPYRLM